MGKTIYQLLNEVETDFDEYKQTELSPLEKDTYKHQILTEVKNMKMEERKKGKNWKKAAACAAACVVVAGAVALAANPVAAKQLFSSVFGNILDTSDKNAAGENELTEKIAGKATPIQDETNKQTNSDHYATSVESNGITLEVSDVYCDGISLYYTLTMRTDNEDMNKAENVLLYLQDGMMNAPILEGANGESIPAGGMTLRNLKKADDGSYVCMNELSLYTLTKEEREKLQIKDGASLAVKYEIDGLTGVADIEQMDDQGRYKETARVEGKWNLVFPVTIDASKNEVIEINKEQNGVIVENITKTDTTLIVEVDYSGYAAKSSYDFENCPLIDAVVKDSEGNLLNGLGGGGSNGEEFNTLTRVVYDGQKDLVISIAEYADGSEQGTTIAEIPIQLP